MNLVVVAASGLAREALNVVRLLGSHDEVRVLDDDPGRWGGSVGDARVEGGLDLAASYVDDEILVCAGRGQARRSIVGRLTGLGVRAERYATLVHPRVEIPRDCVIGRGSIVLEGAVLTADVRVGRHVVIMPHATLTHDDVVDDFATICAGVAVGGNVHVGSAAYLGMNSSIREGCTMGADATLGMGAALVTDLPDGETWAGVPARPLSRVEEVRRA